MPACTCQHPAERHPEVKARVSIARWIETFPCLDCLCYEYDAWLVDDKPVEYPARSVQ